jgi:hypothetical protein
MIKDIEERGEPCDLPRGVSGDMAAENEDVQKIIAPRLDKLMDIANSFLDTILASIIQVPYGIRWICKQIRSLTKVIIKLFLLRRTGLTTNKWIIIIINSVDIRMQPSTAFVHLLAVSFFYVSSIQPSLHRMHTCWLMVVQKRIHVVLLLWWVFIVMIVHRR